VTKEELGRLLAANGAMALVSFQDRPTYSEGYYLVRGAEGWSVAFGERGVKREEWVFGSEGDACLFLLGTLAYSYRRPDLLAGRVPMSRTRLAETLDRHSVKDASFRIGRQGNVAIYHLDVEQAGDEWLVVWHRGAVRTSQQEFTNESDACLYALATLVHYLGRPNLLADLQA